MHSSLGFNSINFDFADFRYVFAQISLVDVFKIGPIVFDCNFFKLSPVLIMPSPEVSLLFLGKSPCASHIVFSTVSHLDISWNKISICDTCVSLDHHKLFLILVNGNMSQVATFDLLIKAVEEGQGYMLVLLMLELPRNPLLLLNLKILKYT